MTLTALVEIASADDCGTGAEELAAGTTARLAVLVEVAGAWKRRSPFAELTLATGAVSRQVIIGAAMQTDPLPGEGGECPVGAVEAKAVVTSVGPRLYLAQSQAIARAEVAATAMEQLQAGDGTAGGAVAYSAQLQGVSAARTGGRQVKKAQLRRQAATAGVDVLTWSATQNRQRHELADVVGSGEVRLAKDHGVGP